MRGVERLLCEMCIFCPWFYEYISYFSYVSAGLRTVVIAANDERPFAFGTGLTLDWSMSTQLRFLKHRLDGCASFHRIFP